ncbi:fumarylacetoacetate hydrolase family protein [Nocardia sp. bgisy134]|uniref:fumarylacetoacetate hydrolase family protein n=1 Tax=unclassified Nocardia TaxID=2637762 RepID=UPI003D722BC0
MAKWASYQHEGKSYAGVVVGDNVHAAPGRATLLDLIGAGPVALAQAAEQAATSPAHVAALADVTLGAPISNPPALRDCLCFLDHMRNCQLVLAGNRDLNDTWYQRPAFYIGCNSTILGPFDDAPKAPGTMAADFELEIAAVVYGTGPNLTVEEAQRAIVGYTLFNDWTGRDHQLADQQLGLGQAKGKDCGTTLGPFLVTPDELEEYFADGRLNLSVTALVNDEVIGSGSLSSADWTLAEMISFASRGVPLRAGEVFGSGTVPTCTLVEHLGDTDPTAFRWLQEGDLVTLRVDHLGETRQKVVGSADPHPLRTLTKPQV